MGTWSRTREFEWRLAGFAVRGVAAAPAAVLLELDPIPVVVPVLLGYVVAPFALAAFERDMDTAVAGHLITSGLSLERKL